MVVETDILWSAIQMLPSHINSWVVQYILSNQKENYTNLRWKGSAKPTTPHTQNTTTKQQPLHHTNGLTCTQIWGDTVRKNLFRLDLKSPYFWQIAVAICCLSTTGGICFIRSAIAKTTIILLIYKIYAPIVLILSHGGLVCVET